MPRHTDHSADVAFVDFRGYDTRPEDPHAFVEFATTVDTRFSSTVSAAEGVIQPWNLLIVDTPEGLRKFADFYVKLGTSMLGFQIVILVDLGDESENLENASVVLPQAVLDLRQKVKLIFIGDHRGVLWSAGGMIPHGVVYWDRDPSGLQTVGIVEDVMREGAIFDELFRAMQQRDADAWVIGTKQVWMGKLSGELTQDVFVDVGKDVVGRGRLAPREMGSWMEPDLLVGEAEVPGVLVENGVLAESFASIQKSVTTSESSFGIGGMVKRTLLQRIAMAPARQQSLVRLSVDEVQVLQPKVSSLLHSIDATNGFDRDELRHLKQDGIDLLKARTTEEASQQLENLFVEGILNIVQGSIEDGHSIEQLLLSVEESARRVAPRTHTEIDFQIESAISAVSAALETTLKAQSVPPKSLIFRLGRRIAQALSVDLIRYVLGFLYLWVLTSAIFQIVGLKDAVWTSVWPSAIRKTAHVSAIGAGCVLLLLVAVAGLLLNAANTQIKNWGLSHQFGVLRSTISELKSSLIKVATNDWASFEMRERVHAQLNGLCDVLALVSKDVSDRFIDPFEQIDPDELDGDAPNPQVRQDLNAKAQGRAFKYIAEIKEILRIDLASIINQSLQYTYALKAPAGMARVPSRVHADLSRDLDRYVRDGRHFGLLFEHISANVNARNKRRDLSQRIWGEPGLVDEAIRNVVLMTSPVEVVTFISPNHLRLIAADESESSEIRFFPTHATGRLAAISSQISYSPDVVTTESMSAAGVIRLTPFKSGVIEFN